MWLQRRLRAFPIACSVLLALMGWSCGQNTLGKVRITNMTGDTIEHLSVAVAGNDFEVLDLPPASAIGIVFPIRVKSSYQIEARLRSSAIVRDEIGYVDPGVYFSDEISVSANELKLAEHHVQPTPFSSSTNSR